MKTQSYVLKSFMAGKSVDDLARERAFRRIEIETILRYAIRRATEKKARKA